MVKAVAVVALVSLSILAEGGIINASKMPSCSFRF